MPPLPYFGKIFLTARKNRTIQTRQSRKTEKLLAVRLQYGWAARGNEAANAIKG
jgi:hypothetical protein